MPSARQFSDTAYDAVTAFLRDALGLHYAAENRLHLEKALAPLLDEWGIESYELFYAELLGRRADAPTLESLVRLLTIGETYFFREPAVLTAVKQHCAAIASGHRTCRLWSAGCCSGEEPYSIAMLLEDGGLHDYSILATDINNQFLEKAVVGTYRQWSLRAIPTYFAEKYFSPLQQGISQIDPALRAKISFKYVNLAEEMVIPIGAEREGFDAILCRNVLMYFSDALRGRIINDFYRALAPGGMLAVGLTELNYVDRKLFSAIYEGQSVVFVKKTEVPLPAETRAEYSGLPAAQDNGIRHLYNAGNYAEVVECMQQGLACGEEATLEEFCLAIRAAGNLGQLQAGIDIAAAGNNCYPNDALLQFLAGQLKMERDDYAGALNAFQSAIAANAGFIAARYSLAAIHRLMGNLRGCYTELTAVQQMLAGQHPAAMVPEFDGMAAGTLAAVVETLLREEYAG